MLRPIIPKKDQNVRYALGCASIIAAPTRPLCNWCFLADVNAHAYEINIEIGSVLVLISSILALDWFYRWLNQFHEKKRSKK